MNSARADIDAPAERVWTILFDRRAWVPGFVAKTPLDGQEDAVGERAYFSSRDAHGRTQTRIEEILFRERPQRLVSRLALAENDATFAFAEWRIASAGAGCLMEMSLFWTDLPAPGSDWAITRGTRDCYVAETQVTIEKLVANIRRCAED